ncbi:serine/threonine-protein kinase [Mycolicibacterium phlei]|jgi:predicted Ser/Thr protein kinase|uniref:serine/threonine-protein kinase n=1 Tax=Mycolicibacterium phlei TaxID=1771 RepID=UPI00025AED7B|nr:serine/threonine-protein kinase [Mycolicibacterium phlei]EID17296.1 putative serine/threonine-protein kinase pknh [Mycolicibacterium phlei RIVM601174]MBF4191208.1 putative serine/threonine-protein kinase pknh [Mycolicibacterium phlei]
MTEPAPGGSRVGSQIGPYRLRRLLGRGGMGEVYEAEDTVKGRVVALKLLPESVSHDPVFRERLQREAHAAGRLQEPHVVPIHDYGEIDGHLFVDMRMIDGTDLRRTLRDGGPMPPARAVAIIRQVASALDAAHAAGILHRDVKPENIILTRDDFAYLVDFGIANAATDERLTELGTAIGTYAYMAPERFSNGDVTYRVDVYALACVLFECLTGSQPFPGDSVSAVITGHLMHPIPQPSARRPDVPPTLDAVVARGMAKRPEHRYATAGELAAAANDALTQQDQTQAATIVGRSQFPPPGVPNGPMWAVPPPPAGQKSTRWVVFAAAAGVLVLVVGAVGAFLLLRPGDTPSAAGPGATTSAADAPSRTAERTTTRRTPRSRAPSVAPGSFDAQLMELLPRGYDDGACEPVRPPVTGSLATVDCGAAGPQGGPAHARYALFADQATLDSAFEDSIAANSELVPCPDSDAESPTTWHFTETPDQVEGLIACGVYNGNQDVTWTLNSALVLGDAQSDDLVALHNWWLKYA